MRRSGARCREWASLPAYDLGLLNTPTLGTFTKPTDGEYDGNRKTLVALILGHFQRDWNTKLGRFSPNVCDHMFDHFLHARFVHARHELNHVGGWPSERPLAVHHVKSAGDCCWNDAAIDEPAPLECAIVKG